MGSAYLKWGLETMMGAPFALVRLNIPSKVEEYYDDATNWDWSKSYLILLI